MIFSHHSGK